MKINLIIYTPLVCIVKMSVNVYQGCIKYENQSFILYSSGMYCKIFGEYVKFGPQTLRRP
jgi:hypothetical protein